MSPGRDGLLLCELYVHFSSEGVFAFPHLERYLQKLRHTTFALDVRERMLGHSSNVEIQRRYKLKRRRILAHLIGSSQFQNKITPIQPNPSHPTPPPGNRPDRMFPSVLLSATPKSERKPCREVERGGERNVEVNKK